MDAETYIRTLIEIREKCADPETGEADAGRYGRAVAALLDGEGEEEEGAALGAGGGDAE